MFFSLKGKLIHIDDTIAVIECAGVGYKCFITATTRNDLPNIGEEAFVYTHLNVREDAMDLFGFSQKSELECFKKLTSVSGVGVKVGIAILSALSPQQIITAIAMGDSKTLTYAPGVGSKLAQRVILELKDKISKIESTVEIKSSKIKIAINKNSQEAINALSVLGYAPVEVSSIVAQFDINLPVEELIRLSLKALAVK